MKSLVNYLVESLKSINTYLIVEENEFIYKYTDPESYLTFPNVYHETMNIIAGDHMYGRCSERSVNLEEIVDTLTQVKSELIEQFNKNNFRFNIETDCIIVINKKYNNLNIVLYINSFKKDVLTCTVKTVYKGSDFKICKNQPVIRI